MSDDNALDTSCCASCGIKEVDDIKLKECADCDLVRYCSDGCQREHKLQHDEACVKRAAELRDELLFRQPESTYLGDCPICCLPMPLDRSTTSIIMTCCSKVICNGCYYANQKREIQGKLERKCPFCRTPIPDTDEADKQMMRRIEANDPVALRREGVELYKKGNHTSAFEYLTKAAELSDVEAQYTLSIVYRDGHGVEKDKGKETHHTEEAAIGGHPSAQYNLGVLEWINNNAERAVKYFIIAATQGHDKSIKYLMEIFKGGFVKKEVLAAALRAHQAAVDATKSPQREEAKQYRRT